VPKGKPWSIEEESALKQLVTAGHQLETIAERLGKPGEAVRQKIRRLGLEVVEQNRSVCSTTSRLILPKELPSIEEALILLAGALKRAGQAGLDKVEVQRLQVVATLAKTYKEALADYINYCEIERRLVDLEAKYARLCEEKTKKASAKPSFA
jgi:hypothetical protein